MENSKVLFQVKCLIGHEDCVTKGKIYNVVNEQENGMYIIEPDDFGHRCGIEFEMAERLTDKISDTKMEGFKGTQGKWTFSIIEDHFTDEKLISIHNENYISNSSDCAGFSDEELDNNSDLCIAGIWSIDEKMIANAQLIAASPELLDALQELVKWRAHLPELANEEIENSVKAINKALGL